MLRQAAPALRLREIDCDDTKMAALAGQTCGFRYEDGTFFNTFIDPANYALLFGGKYVCPIFNRHFRLIKQ